MRRAGQISITRRANVGIGAQLPLDFFHSSSLRQKEFVDVSFIKLPKADLNWACFCFGTIGNAILFV